jgi:hypothetical protein
VRGAAHGVCEPGIDTWTAEYNQRRCYHATLSDAFAQVDRAIELAQSGTLASAARIVVAAR